MAEIKYCGKAKIYNGKYGEIFAISLAPTDIETIIANKNEKGWCNIDMSAMKYPDKNGNIFTLKINEWKKPNQNNDNKSANQSSEPSHRYKQADQPTQHSVDKGNAYQTPANSEEKDDVPF